MSAAARRVEVVLTDGSTVNSNRSTDIVRDHKHRHLSFTDANGERWSINLDQVRWFKIGDPQ